MKKNIIMMMAVLQFCELHGYIKSHLADVLSRSAAGSKVEASKYDLRGAAMSGLQASGGNFFGTKLQPCVQNANNDTLGCCTGLPTDLSDADLSEANFSNAAASSVNFSGADFTNAQLINVDFTGSYFKGATFTGITLVDLTMTANMINSSSTDSTTTVSATDLESTSAATDGSYQLTVFCNAIMPDGTTCSGDSWTAPDGTIIKCNCPSTDSSD